MKFWMRGEESDYWSLFLSNNGLGGAIDASGPNLVPFGCLGLQLPPVPVSTTVLMGVVIQPMRKAALMS